MPTLVGEFTVLALLIVVAGTLLTRFADTLGEAAGLGGTLTGMTLLAIATSLPELAVDSSAAVIGAPDLAVGDLLGSCLFNLLILAVLDTLFRSSGPILSRRAAAHALAAVTCILLASVVLLFLLVDLGLTVGRLGLGTVTVAVTFAACWRLLYFDQRYALDTSEPEEPVERPSWWRAAIGYTLCTAVVLATAPRLASTADALADVSGLGGTFVGTVLLAVTTGLPEVSTTATAVRMGSNDLAIGNIFGSNAFNLLILLPVDAFYAGDLLADVDDTHAITATSVVLVTSVAALGMLYRAERRVWYLEYDAVLVIALVLGAFWLVYAA